MLMQCTLPQSSAAVANMEPYTHEPPSESLAAKYKKQTNPQMETGQKGDKEKKKEQMAACDTAVYKYSYSSWCKAIKCVFYLRLYIYLFM